MRASVIRDFHNPATGEMVRRGTVLTDDAVIKAYEADPELAIRISVSDRTPSAAQGGSN